MFLLPDALAIAVAIASLAAASTAVFVRRRSFACGYRQMNGAALLLLGVVSIRFLVPPYGEPGFHGTGVMRVLLLVGLYALVLDAYRNVPFETLLWTLVIVGSIAAAIAVAMYLGDGGSSDRIEFLGRSAHPIMGAGAVATSLVAVIVLGRHQQRGAYFTIALIAMAATQATALYLSGSRGPMISLLLAILLAPSSCKASWVDAAVHRRNRRLDMR